MFAAHFEGVLGDLDRGSSNSGDLRVFALAASTAIVK